MNYKLNYMCLKRGVSLILGHGVELREREMLAQERRWETEMELKRAEYDRMQTRSSADADKPVQRVWRSVKVTKHSTIPHVRYSFLLCNSNSVFKTRRFYDIRLQKNVVTLKWGQRSLKVIESGIIR